MGHCLNMSKSAGLNMGKINKIHSHLHVETASHRTTSAALGCFILKRADRKPAVSRRGC